MSSPDLSWIPARYIYTVAGVLAATVVSMLWIAAKRMIAALKEEWKTAKSRLETIETTTRVQAENHLSTIQNESIKQTALLNDIRTEQKGLLSETNGYLKAVVEATRK